MPSLGPPLNPLLPTHAAPSWLCSTGSIITLPSPPLLRNTIPTVEAIPLDDAIFLCSHLCRPKLCSTFRGNSKHPSSSAQLKSSYNRPTLLNTPKCSTPSPHRTEQFATDQTQLRMTWGPSFPLIYLKNEECMCNTYLTIKMHWTLHLMSYFLTRSLPMSLNAPTATGELWWNSDF